MRCPFCGEELECVTEDKEFSYYTCACIGNGIVTWKKSLLDKWEYWACPKNHAHSWIPHNPLDREIVQFT
jgi:hypothetical protein